MLSETRVRALRAPRARRVAVLTLIVLGAVLALLWLVGRTLDRNTTTASNAQLVADLQLARTTFESDVAAAARKAATLAHMPRVEAALATGDTVTLQALASAHPDTLLISARGGQRGSLAPLGVRRIVEVVSGGRTIGRVVTDAPLDSTFLSRVAANMPIHTHDVLVVTDRGKVASGPMPAGLTLSAASPRDVHVQGRTYRALSSPLASDRPELQVVALAPGGANLVSAWRLPLAALATLVALGLLVVLSAAVLRDRERTQQVPRLSEPAEVTSDRQQAARVELLGEELAATNDVEALLRVILDAAIKATGAKGGRVARPGEPASRVGESGNEMLRVPLETNETGGDSWLLLYPPPSGFGAEAAEIAHWLGTHASRAIRDTQSHRVAQEPGVNDELTGLANRRHFTSMLEREFARAEHLAAPLSVVLSDLDDFKAVGARLSNRSRDKLLKAYAAALQRCSREIDVAARIGGEKFGLLLPQTDAEGARQVAERLRSELRAEQGLPGGPLTASFGIASYPQARSAEELLISADASLRRAKESGKDQIVVADDSRPPAATA
jgi:diguanylate cyclase (GGDEF)-like protein